MAKKVKNGRALKRTNRGGVPKSKHTNRGGVQKTKHKRVMVPVDNSKLEIVSPEPKAYLEPSLLKPLAACTVLLYVWLWTMLKTMPRLRDAAFQNGTFADKAVLVGHLLATAAVGVLALNLLQAFGFTVFSDPKACALRCSSKSCGHLVKASRGITRKLHIDKNGYMWEVKANAPDPGDAPTDHECLLTPWSVTHMFCYLTVGFLAPKAWYISLGASVAWEIAEYQDGAHDWMDIFINASSIGTGMLIRKALWGTEQATRSTAKGSN